MEQNEGQQRQQDTGESQKPETEESPAEKLEATTPTGSLIPGPENPESKEIKEERSPNTE